MKRIAALALVLLSLAASARAQSTDSTIYVKQYPGTTVAAKVTAAMVSCPASPTPCILVIDPSLATAAEGTLPTLCSNCFLSDWREGPPALALAAISKFDSNFNLSIGTSTETALAGGYQNVAYGAFALQNVTTGPWNVGIGMSALQANTTGDNNTAVGTDSLLLNTTGYQNTALGSGALYNNLTGFFNDATGMEALWQLQSGDLNTSDGVSNLTHMTAGNFNSAFGGNAMAWVFGGSSNSAFGLNADYGSYAIITAYSFSSPHLTLTLCAPASYPASCPGTPPVFTAGDSFGINVQSGNLSALNGLQGTVTSATSTTVTITTSLVSGSGNATSSGSTEPPEMGWQSTSNTAIGADALQGVTTGSYNSGVGWDTLTALSSGALNDCDGTHSCFSLSSGSQNAVAGDYALNDATTASNETVLGFRAGAPDDSANYDVSGTNNVWIGSGAGPSGTAPYNNSIAIGANAQTTASEQAVIGNAGVTDFYAGSVSAKSKGHFAGLDQGATRNYAGTCSMSSGTSCTFSLTAAYTSTPICISTEQGTSAVASACSVSGTTVTITAASSNSNTWGAVLIGNPN